MTTMRVERRDMGGGLETKHQEDYTELAAARSMRECRRGRGICLTWMICTSKLGAYAILHGHISPLFTLLVKNKKRLQYRSIRKMQSSITISWSDIAAQLIWLKSFHYYTYWPPYLFGFYPHYCFGCRFY